MRLVFMGTPGFAVPSLQYLLEAGYPIVGVITAPDKPGGRGMKQLISSPVKQLALDYQIPVLQPLSLKSKAFLQELRELRADLQVVVAFRMLPEIVWAMPRLGTLNLHGSLLPAYRGAAPIQWAIIRGERITGVTTFFLQHEIDTGHLLLQREIPILPDDTAGDLHDRMMHIGAGVVLATADQIALGIARPHPQDDANVSHAPKIHHDTGRIDWSLPADRIYDLIRGMAPYPGAWTLLDHQEIKILKARPAHIPEFNGEPGTLMADHRRLFVKCGSGSLELMELQLSGKRRMRSGDFLNGYRITDWRVT